MMESVSASHSANLTELVGSNPDLANALAQVQVGADRVQGRLDSTRQTEINQKRAHHKQMQRTIEAMEKAANAKRGGLVGKIFGWIAKVVALIAAVAATVATGGAASPLLAAAVVLMAYDMVASIVSEASGGSVKIGLTDGCSQLMTAVAKACGADDKTAKDVGNWAGMALALVIELGVSAAALAPGKVADVMKKIAEQLTKISTAFAKIGTTAGRAVSESFAALAKPEALKNLVQTLSKLKPPATVSDASRATGVLAEAEQTTNAATRLAKGAQYMNITTQVGNAAVGVAVETVNLEAEKARADAMDAQALLNFLSAAFENEKEKLDFAVQELKSSTSKVQQMAASHGELQQTITSNFGAGGAVAMPITGV